MSQLYSLNQKHGTANDNGTNFENYMFLITLLRCLQNNKIIDFLISKNCQELGVFDDLVVRVKYKSIDTDEVITNLILIQTKHRECRTVSPEALVSDQGNKKFKLKKFYEDFCNIKEKIGTFKSDLLKECTFQEMIFVIYTNAKCEFAENNYPHDSFVSKMLKTGLEGSKIFKFKNTPKFAPLFELMQDAVKHPILNDQNGFFDKLIFFSGQSSVEKLQECLISEVKAAIGNKDISLTRTLDQLQLNSMKFWINNFFLKYMTDFKVDFQGAILSIHDLDTLFNNSIATKFILKSVFHGKDISIGKKLKESETYYIKRNVWTFDYESNRYRKVLSKEFDKNRLVLLCAKPGMGKSWFVTYEAKRLKEKHPHKWIIRENFSDCRHFLNTKYEFESEKVYDFLLSIAGVEKHTADESMFKYCLENEDKMIIYLDGLDEIGPTHFLIACGIIKIIINKYKAKLWVSTRPIEKQKLEELFNVKIWEIEEFSEQDSKNFIEKYCDIQNFSLKSVKLKPKLLGFPILCKMIGDIIKKGGNVQKFEETTNLIDIYDKFVDLMYKTYHTDKAGYDLSNAIVKHDVEKVKQLSLENHGMLAIAELYGLENLSKIGINIEKECKKFLNEIIEAKEKTGFVVDIDTRDEDNIKPVFLHRSIMEYFAALWMVKHNTKYQKIRKKFCQKFSITVDYFRMWKLGESNCCFRNILNGCNTEQLKNCIDNHNFNINSEDEHQRNALNCAIIGENKDAIRYILANGLEITERNVEKWIKYYGESELYKKEICSCLSAHWLKKNLQNDSPHSTFLLYAESPDSPVFYYFNKLFSNGNPLHNAILDADFNEIDKLMESEEHINIRNKVGFTPLHFASYYGNKNLIRKLALKNASYNKCNSFHVYPHEIVNAKDQDAYDLLKRMYGNLVNLNEQRDLLLASNFRNEDLIFHSIVRRNELGRSSSNINARDYNDRTALHVAAAAACNGDIYNYILTQSVVEYSADRYELFPHDYATLPHMKRMLMGYGFGFYLEQISNNEKKIYGIDIEDVIIDEFFKRGLRAKLYQQAPVR